jgi:hypothetical protein
MDSHCHLLDLDETQFKWNKVQQKEGIHTSGMQDLNSRSQGQRGSVSSKISHARHTFMSKFAWLWNSLARKQHAPNTQGLKVPDCIVCYTARSVLYSHLIDWCYSTQGSELHPEKVSSLKVCHFSALAIFSHPEKVSSLKVCHFSAFAIFSHPPSTEVLLSILAFWLSNLEGKGAHQTSCRVLDCSNLHKSPNGKSSLISRSP